MDTRPLTLPLEVWEEVERRAAAGGCSPGEAIAAALAGSPTAAPTSGAVPVHVPVPAPNRPRRRSGTASDWTCLPDEVAENLFARVASAADARAVGRVCKDWAIGLIASCRVGWVAERGCATAERTGQWRRDWPNAERLEISLTAPSCLLRDTLVNVPELQQLKALRIERHPYRRSFVDNLPEEKLQALEELELECMIGDDLEGVFGYQHTGGGGWLRNLTALRKLSLAGCTLEPWNLWALGEALSLQDLTVAGGNFKWSSAGMGLQWLGQLVGLKRLEFRCQTTLLPGMLEHLSRLTELEHLALHMPLFIE